MEDCIFCKIGKGEIPSTKVYEDENFLAFLDIKPVSYGHTLIIPKKHSVWMQETGDELVAGIFVLAKKLMLAIKEGLKCHFIQVSVVGTELPHFHVHLIPRYYGDKFKNFPTIEYERAAAKETADKIIQAL